MVAREILEVADAIASAESGGGFDGLDSLLAASGVPTLRFRHASLFDQFLEVRKQRAPLRPCAGEAKFRVRNRHQVNRCSLRMIGDRLKDL